MNQNSFAKLSQAGRLAQVASLCLLLIGGSMAPLYAEALFLAAGHPDGISLLPDPPAAGSREEEADLESARAVFKGRTPEEEARAFKDSTLAFSLFEPVIGPHFQLDKLPRTEALLNEVKKEIRKVIDEPKNHWKRKRPYQMDPELNLGKPESSFSYPSGHSTCGTVYSLVLAELVPEKREAILQIGRNIGWDRVIIGKHFPSDVLAGRVLGQAIVHEMLSNTNFQHAVADARAEIKAAQK